MQKHGQPLASSSASYPEFHPHITLASFPSSSAPSLLDMCSAIPTNQGSVSVEFRSMDIGSHYFRSVYIAIKHTSSLRALHEHIHTRLGAEPHTPAFPHLSLCYIADEDSHNGERVRFFDDLNGNTTRRESQSVGLRYGGEGKDDVMNGFEASEIWIVNCDGPVDQWTVLHQRVLIT